MRVRVRVRVRVLSLPREVFSASRVSTFGDRPCLCLCGGMEECRVRGVERACGGGGVEVEVVEVVDAGEVCGGSGDDVRLGYCQGPMPFGDDTARIHAWQNLVTEAVRTVGNDTRKIG